MTAATETWATALARLQDDLDAIDRALATGSDVVTLPWTPPTDLGPLPPQLRSRASELHARIARATSQLKQTQGELAGERRDVDRRRQASAAYHGVASGNDRHRTA